MSIHWSRELQQTESLPFCDGQNQEVGCLDLNGSFSTTEESLKMEVSFDLEKLWFCGNPINLRFGNQY